MRIPGEVAHESVMISPSSILDNKLDRQAPQQPPANGDWIDAHDNLILCGPTGVGKSRLACALGHRACRDNRSVLYQRVPKLFAELALARGDGRYARILLSSAMLLRGAAGLLSSAGLVIFRANRSPQTIISGLRLRLRTGTMGFLQVVYRSTAYR